MYIPYLILSYDTVPLIFKAPPYWMLSENFGPRKTPYFSVYTAFMRK